MSVSNTAEPPLPSPPESPSKNKHYQPFGFDHLTQFNANNQAQDTQPLPDGLPDPSRYAPVHEHDNHASPGGPVMRVGQPVFHGIDAAGYGEAYDDLVAMSHGPEYTYYPMAPIPVPHYGDPEHYGNTPPVTPPALEVDARRTPNSMRTREQKRAGNAKSSGASLPKLKKPKETRPPKKKIEKSDDSPINMPVPLFELLLDIPLVDAEAYIRRPKELREEEWRNRRDFPKMPRPVNVFLLYRRAVSERAKKYAGVTNHQVVSKIAGVSWKNESDEVKDIFNQYAELEKEYHDKAFPDYKFNPKKTQSAKGKGKGKGEGGDTDESDGDDDPEYTERTSTRKKKSRVELKRTTNIEQSAPHAWEYSTQYQFDAASAIPNQLPYPTDPRYLPQEVFHGQVSTGYDHRYDIGDFQGNLQLGLLASNASTQIGLPGGNHDLLLGNTAAMQQPGHFDANALDPSLFSFDTHDSGFFSGAYNSHDNFAPNNLEYTPGDFPASPRQPQDWELSEQNTPINDPVYGEVFEQIKE